MQKRRFYRLDEISDVSTVTKGDLLEAIDNDKLSLCALIEGKSLGYFHMSNVLANVFDYKGVVRLSLEVTKKLLTEGKADTNIVSILEPEKIENWRRVEVAYPDVSTERFEQVLAFTPPETPIRAYASIQQIDDWRGHFKNTLRRKMLTQERDTRFFLHFLTMLIKNAK
ncbi:hypothetical protein [Enterovibrio coralii]|uniref:Uncharacterized protein n=1 Tax=Enterovibrio coralii TaxID=294935 RepID=A0A135I4F7_9GAMM|nr:hypothetical protein [Enterovibrio coralii]KXF80329.1 hypothetical protein ATN88_10945 [Enterovibrio coralii]